jgi:hypothetical protein
MNSRVKILVLVCLLIFLVMFVDCARRPIILGKVFTQPNTDFKMYKRLAVTEFTPDPFVKKDKNLTCMFEEEFRKNGYDVVGMDKFNLVLEEYGYSNEDLSGTEALNRITERLDISAIIKGTVNKYEVEEEKGYMSTFMTEYGIIRPYEMIYNCDISFSIEMIEAKYGKKVWTCSVLGKRKTKKPEAFVMDMIRNCLNTILKK